MVAVLPAGAGCPFGPITCLHTRFGRVMCLKLLFLPPPSLSAATPTSTPSNSPSESTNTHQTRLRRKVQGYLRNVHNCASLFKGASTSKMDGHSSKTCDFGGSSQENCESIHAMIYSELLAFAE